jgi:hypothetical protein
MDSALLSTLGGNIKYSGWLLQYTQMRRGRRGGRNEKQREANDERWKIVVSDLVRNAEHFLKTIFQLPDSDLSGLPQVGVEKIFKNP